MEKQLIICYGDSNTYGFDPRSYLGSRYPKEIRWTGILDSSPRWTVRNEGVNGRVIPFTEDALDDAADMVRWSAPPAAVVVMLGGNDLLQRPFFKAEDVTARMETLLRRLLDARTAGKGNWRLLLIAPAAMVSGEWVTEDRLLTESARLAPCYRALAEKLGIDFADANEWGVEKLFDGVHFSEAGHRSFAEGISKMLDQMFP